MSLECQHCPARARIERARLSRSESQRIEEVAKLSNAIGTADAMIGMISSCSTCGDVRDAILEGYFGTRNVQFSVDSLVTNTTHVFNHTDDLINEVKNARIYAGFHYRHSVDDGVRLGQRVAKELLKRFLQTRKAPQLSTINVTPSATVPPFRRRWRPQLIDKGEPPCVRSG
jgi:hypothetical protein